MKRFGIRTIVMAIVSFMLFSCTQMNKPAKFNIRTGVNVSHWLSQSEKRGEERLNYITKADFDTIAATGFDHIRLPIDEVQMWDSIGNKQQEAFQLMHNAINWAFEANLRVIVDLHIIRSHYFNAETNELWTNPAEQDKLVDMWRQLSEELKQYPNDKLAYEILNEAVADNPEDWNNLFSKVLADIRLREPNRVVVIGSNRWQIPSTFADLKIPEGDTNIILSFHFYSPNTLTHHLAPWTETFEYKGPVNYPGWIVDTNNYKDLSEKTVAAMRRYANGYFDKDVLEKEMMPAIEVAKKYNLQLFCGEYGIFPSISEDLSLKWYKDVCEIFNKHHIAYCHWAYKGDFPVIKENNIPNYNLIKVLTAN